MSALKNVFTDGILMSVTVRFWSGGVMLTPEDMGLKPEDLSDAFKLGKKMLVPESVIREFRTVENQARRVVKENSFDFPIGSASFVPKSKIEKVLEQLRLCQRDYNILINSLVDNYDDYKTQMLPIYKEAAKIAFMKQLPTGIQEFNLDDRTAQENAFVNKFMRKIEALYPTTDSLRARFSLSWDLYELGLASGIANEEYRIAAREKIGKFFEDVVSTLRQDTLEICNRIIENINGGKIIKTRTLRSLRETIDKIQELNFVGDTKIEEQLNLLRAEFLNVHEDGLVGESPDLQMELHTRLVRIAEAVSDTTDVSAITGQYKRKISWEVKD